MTSSTEIILERLFGSAREQDLQGVLELWHEKGVLEDMTLCQRRVGKEDVAEYLYEYFRAFPELEYIPEEIWTIDDRAVVLWHGQTKVETSFFGIPAYNGSLSLQGVDLFWVEEGLIVGERSWYGDGWLFHRICRDGKLCQEMMEKADYHDVK